MSFDTLAPHYRWMESVLAGPLLQQCRTRYLGHLAAARNVLVLGPGRSRFAAAMLTAAPDARLTLVDSSHEMLEHLGRDLRDGGAAMGRVTLVHADAREWTPSSAPFDTIATHFFLDCFAPVDLAALVARVAQWSIPGTRWLVSDFRMPAAGWRRHRALAIHALMYAFFRAATGIAACAVTPPDAYLARARFRLVQRQLSNLGLLHADLWVRSTTSSAGAGRGIVE